MPRPTREIRRRDRIPSGTPEQLAKHFATAGRFHPADERAAWATFKPTPDDWKLVRHLVRRAVTARAFALLDAEFSEGGACRPFVWWPADELAELRGITRES
ncbi:MAG TPA: hypothetical protein VGE08_17535 [Steroidobacter sp.]|uniref:hypothetical protein n=1 Tax=Steroidobacter sp. TaxID=1978227 RepID=UPI002ED9451E